MDQEQVHESYETLSNPSATAKVRMLGRQRQRIRLPQKEERRANFEISAPNDFVKLSLNQSTGPGEKA